MICLFYLSLVFRENLKRAVCAADGSLRFDRIYMILRIFGNIMQMCEKFLRGNRAAENMCP